MALDAYLLTREWRDTQHGVELSFWASSALGPIHIIVPAQEAVCFIERDVSAPLPTDARRQPLALKKLYGKPVDGLYFKQQRQLNRLREQPIALCESDVKPVDRYLMERFVQASLGIQGDLINQGTHWQVISPHVRPTSYQPTLKSIAIDIETRANTHDLYSIAVASRQSCGALANEVSLTQSAYRPHLQSANVVFMLGAETSVDREQYHLHYCRSERHLLSCFFDWVIEHDPDIITGWSIVNFDLRFIAQKCRSLGIPFAMGRGDRLATVLEPNHANALRLARVPGRVVLDGIDLLKAGFWAFESYSLDNVAHQLLGTGKLIDSGSDKVSRINDLFNNDKPQLADYNFRDCTLVNDIFESARLLEFAIEKANLTGLSLDRSGGSVAAFDHLYLPRLHRHGFVAPDVDDVDDGLASPGGYVMDSIPGLYKNILVLDFKSLYPSIIRTFKIDPLGLAEPGINAIQGFSGALFSRDRHILPQLIEELWTARDRAKKTNNSPLSQAIKIIMNSFYGVLGSTGCRFYSSKLASSITRRGHEIITQSRDWVNANGYSVIYGDTDSLFVHVGEQLDASHCRQIGQTLMNDLNAWWASQLQQRYRLDSKLEVEFETHYSRFFMPTVRGLQTGSKKRYAGLIRSGDTDRPNLIVKGLEAARTDWTPLARNFQRELLLRVFLDQPFEQYIQDLVIRLQKGELDEHLVYSKRIRRSLESYVKNVPPHIQAAKKLPRPGRVIQYVITSQGPEPLEAQVHRLDYQHYMNKQLAPAADSILHCLEKDFATIASSQLNLF